MRAAQCVGSSLTRHSHSSVPLIAMIAAAIAQAATFMVLLLVKQAPITLALLVSISSCACTWINRITAAPWGNYMHESRGCLHCAVGKTTYLAD